MKKKDKFISYSILGLLILIIVYDIGKNLSDRYYLSKQRKYSITTRIRSGSSSKISGESYLYFFYINSKEYGGVTHQGIDVDKSYFVEFYPPDPDKNSIIKIEATADDKKHMPPSGYDHLPHN
jgi:hypothetical protein